MLKKQLIVFVVFALVMAAITGLSYVVTATSDNAECRHGFIDRAAACR